MSIQKSTKDFILSIWGLKKPQEWQDDTWEDQKVNMSDTELIAWWQDKFFLEEKEDRRIQRIYDQKHHIALDPYYAFVHYLSFYQGIDFEENRPKDKYLDVKEDLSTKKLKDNYFEIYKSCYLDKISVDQKLIINLKFKIADNKFKIKDDAGFTLNDVAYLGQQLAKVHFWFSKVIRIEATIIMRLSLKDTNTLLVELATHVDDLTD